MGDTLTVFAKRSSLLAMAFWTLVCVALAAVGIFRDGTTQTNATPSMAYQAAAVSLTVVTVLAWTLTVFVRRTGTARLLAVLCCGLSFVITYYFFVEREPSAPISATSNIIGAVALFLTMVCLLWWQTFGRHDEPAAAK